MSNQYIIIEDNHKTDLERFVELYKSFGIELRPKEEENGRILIQISKMFHNHIDGDYDCSTEVYFTITGRFVVQFIEKSKKKTNERR
jgi:hypothetical protein